MKKVMGWLLGCLMVMVFACSLMAKGVEGEYSTRVQDGYTFQSPNAGSVLDQAGTRWNLIDDIYRRQLDNYGAIDYNAQVTVSSLAARSGFSSYVSWAGSATHTLDQIGNYVGWTIAVPTAAVSWDRVKVRIFNPDTNTQTMWVNLATGTALGLLSYPATGYYMQDLTPGESWEINVSSIVHPIIMSSGTFSTEKAQVTQIK